MTSDERRDSLADQAAAWVPPWARTPSEQAEQPTAEPTETTEAEAVPEPAPLAVPEPAPLAVPEPAPLAVPESPPLAVPESPPLAVPENAEVSDPASGFGPAPGSGSAEAAPVPLPLIDDDELRGALEAILLVVDEPVAEIVLAEVLEQPTGRVAAMLGQLAGDYTAAGHGFELRRAAGGWRLYTRPEYATYVERFVLNGQAVRLTQAALETLAVVAYKQPVTRSRISAIRGVNCDGVIRTLVSRGLVEECGTEPDSAAFLYRTTTLFLEKLGLNTVDELPPLAPFLPDDLEEIADAPR